MSLQGKVGLVTGGGSGIGRATAMAMAKAGTTIVLGNRNCAQGEEVVQAIRNGGGSAVFQQTDVTRPEQIEALVERTVREFGRLDLAFNNAGFDGQQAPLHQQDLEQAAYVLDVNVKGVFYAMKFEIDAMLKTGGGAIVNNSSVLGLSAVANMSPYVASKFAVAGLTRAAALDYAKQGIRVNAVAPGPIETPMLVNVTGGNPHSYAKAVPAGRIGQADEVAAAVIWLLSNQSSFVTGHVLPVDGGWCA